MIFDIVTANGIVYGYRKRKLSYNVKIFLRDEKIKKKSRKPIQKDKYCVVSDDITLDF